MTENLSSHIQNMAAELIETTEARLTDAGAFAWTRLFPKQAEDVMAYFRMRSHLRSVHGLPQSLQDLDLEHKAIKRTDDVIASSYEKWYWLRANFFLNGGFDGASTPKHIYGLTHLPRRLI
jgi:hypothetical protein